MSILYNKEEREVIPRLRTFDLTLSTGELFLPMREHTDTKFSKYHNKLKDKWEANNNIINAKKLYSSAMILGIENKYNDLAKFILKEENDSSYVNGYIRKKLNSNTISYIELQNKERIRGIRNKLKDNPKNPILWMELSRCYLLENEEAKAIKFAEISISLDKNNRYILRSSSSLFNQLGDSERALKTIRLSEYHKHDPWLLSADLAFSNLLKRKSRLIDNSIKLLREYENKPNYITELLSSVGTYEYKHGSHKKVNKYLNESLLDPTDNSLAQAIWLADKNIIDEQKLLTEINNTKLNFEAKTLNLFNTEDFNGAYIEALKWYDDEPYSIRPINIASHIDCVFLKKYDRSIGLMKSLLDKGFSDKLSVNNLVYMLLKKGNLEEAQKYHEMFFPKILIEEEDNPVYIATTGMLKYRSNLIEEGYKLYQQAISLARKNKQQRNLLMAMGNYLIESFITDDFNPERTKIRKEFIEKASKTDESEIKEILKDFLKLESVSTD